MSTISPTISTFSITSTKNYNPIKNNKQPIKAVNILTSGSNFLSVNSDKNSCFISSKIIKGCALKSVKMSTSIEKLGVKIERNPSESTLSQLGVRQWPKWGCSPSKFPWTYEAKETCYLLQGKVKVYPEGSDEAVEIGAGDLVVFPKGMSCTWDVSEAVDKHYKFE